MQTVSAFAPATIANVGAAFDVLGFAISEPGDTVTATATETPGVLIIDISGDNGALSREPEKNTAGVAVLSLLRHLGSKDKTYARRGVSLSLTKGLSIGSGLGSSSASAAAAVFAVNTLLGSPLTRQELVPFAMEGERVACGVAHADNVAPSLMGGFVLIRSYDPLDIIHLPTPVDLWIAVISPELELKTRDARKILKKSVPLEVAVAQWGNVAALIAGIYTNDATLIGRSLEDKIIEPERSQLIPGYTGAKKAALLAGAYGCSISGSGPSIFAICGSQENASVVGSAMQSAFHTIGIPSTAYISQTNSAGAVITDTR